MGHVEEVHQTKEDRPSKDLLKKKWLLGKPHTIELTEMYLSETNVEPVEVDPEPSPNLCSQHGRRPRSYYYRDTSLQMATFILTVNFLFINIYL